MIHQLIFANPKPGMGIKEFQDYWIYEHGMKYASKIPQIKKYKVNRILASEGEKSIYHGMAEIWLENEEEQLASLQTDEYIKGARMDEPNWAAFWESLCLDTFEYKILPAEDKYRIKLVLLLKRKEGIPLQVFRDYLLEIVSKKMLELPHLKRLSQCIVKDNFYAAGEAKFDAACQIWFECFEDLKDTKDSDSYKEKVLAPLSAIAKTESIFTFVCEENEIKNL